MLHVLVNHVLTSAWRNMWDTGQFVKLKKEGHLVTIPLLHKMH